MDLQLEAAQGEGARTKAAVNTHALQTQARTPEPAKLGPSWHAGPFECLLRQGSRLRWASARQAGGQGGLRNVQNAVRSVEREQAIELGGAWPLKSIGCD